MKKTTILHSTTLLVVFLIFLMASPAWAGFKMEFGKHTKAEIGFWGQTWFQYVEDGTAGGEKGLKDFMLRRGYFYLKGDVTQYLSFLTNIAADKVGMDTGTKGVKDVPGTSLGSGFAFRDLWVSVNLHDWAKIKLGRMYVPLTRAYGTTSTKAMMTLDLPFLQGGSRGNILYAQKVGRDDSVVLWGNPLDGLLQYRLMVGEGVEGSNCAEYPPGHALAGELIKPCNPDDNVRVAGRIAVSLLDPETGWFNKGTYLGAKKVLSIGAGIDRQGGLQYEASGKADQDSLTWTVDVFFDYPVGNGAVTVETAYIGINNSTQNHPEAYTDLLVGDDARNGYLNAGYLINNLGPGSLQPYFRYEFVDVKHKNMTHFASGGLNYYLNGHNAKLTADYMYVHPENDAKKPRNLFTFQIAIGF
jgi:hypothetical protein